MKISTNENELKIADGELKNEKEELMLFLSENNTSEITQLTLSECSLSSSKDINILMNVCNQLDALNSIYFEKNQLPSDGLLYRELAQLSNLRFISFSTEDKKNKSLVEQISNSNLEALRRFPSLRAYKAGSSAEISFLTLAESNFLIENIRKVEKTIKLENILEKKGTLINAFLKEYENLFLAFPHIKAVFEYRNTNENLKLPPETTNILQFIDSLSSTGVILQYSPTNRFVLNFKNASFSTIERVLLLLEQKYRHFFPDGLSLDLAFPTVSTHFTKEYIKEIIRKCPQITVPDGLHEVSKITPNHKLPYENLYLLNTALAKGGNEFYSLLNNESLFFKLLANIRDYLMSTKEHNSRVELIYEIFVAHSLCSIPGEIDNIVMLKTYLPADNKSKKNILNNLKKQIITLLYSDEKALSLVFSDDSGLHETEKAQAFWGRSAIYDVNSAIAGGMFCYGRYLDRQDC